ncbi:MAG: hypothetical protein QOI04_1905 [Verrucomicrobiota bacterium]|jgi:hypothetical protein
MQDLLHQIRTARDAGLYYISLMSALALPDICGALEAADGFASGARYEAWFDKHVGPKYNGFFAGADCYLFRCSFLHQGRTQHPRGKYSRILFLEPAASGVVMHNNILNGALNIDVRIFCEDLVSAVEVWLPEAKKLPHFANNLSQFVTRHPNGLAPYIVGLPVIG